MMTTKRIEFKESAIEQLNSRTFTKTINEAKSKIGTEQRKGKLKNGLWYEIMKKSIIIF